MNILYLLSLALALAIPDRYADVTRNLMKKHNAPDWVVVIDAVQHKTLAFTDVSTKKIYIDFNRFANAPNSLKNVIYHEIEHTKGRNHNNVSNDIMGYFITLNAAGDVIDDVRVWP